LGGSIGGPPLRAIRGGSELWSDPVIADRGRTTEVDLGGGRKVNVGGSTYGDLADAMFVDQYTKNPGARGRLSVHLPGMRRHRPLSHRVDPERLVVTYSSLPRGVLRGQETGFTGYLRALQEAQKMGLGYSSDSSLNSMSRRVYEKLQEKGIPFVPREFYRDIDGDLVGAPHTSPLFDITPEELAKVDLDEIMAAGGPASTAHVPPRAPDMSNVPPGERAKAFLRAGGVKKMLKSAFSPASLLMDATIGAGVGAASALAGYAAGQPRSAGVFNLPGEYQQALSQEDLLAQIEAKNVRKEALRQKYIDEVNALHGPGTLQPGARIEEISNYLGPVRGLQGR